MLTVTGSNIFNQREILESLIKGKEENVYISSVCFYFDYWTVVIGKWGRFLYLICSWSRFYSCFRKYLY